MKKSLIYIIIALLVASCSGNKQSFTLTGKFKGLDQGEFLCFSESAEWGTLDTIKVLDGRFSLTHPLSDTAIITLQYPNFMQTQIIAIPGKEIVLKGDANNMINIQVEGDDENEAFSEFRSSIIGLKETELEPKICEFIEKNPHLWASLALFEKYFLEAENPDYKKIEKLFGLMLKARPERIALRTLEGQISSLLKCGVGSKLPVFKTVTINGTPVDNGTFKGKALLITFWSSMSNDFIYPVVSPRHLMRRLSSKIAQLNICLDVDTASCQRIIRTDTLGGYNICDRFTFNSPLVGLFGMKQLPANILVDSCGIIRARDINVDKLEATLCKFGIQ